MYHCSCAFLEKFTPVPTTRRTKILQTYVCVINNLISWGHAASAKISSEALHMQATKTFQAVLRIPMQDDIYQFRVHLSVKKS